MLKKFEFISSDAQATVDLGKNFSKELKPGDVIGLNGNLGSGKTTFIKGILEGLNYKDNVTSPTFTLINEYDANYKVLHVDFYRDKNWTSTENKFCRGFCNWCCIYVFEHCLITFIVCVSIVTPSMFFSIYSYTI